MCRPSSNTVCLSQGSVFNIYICINIYGIIIIIIINNSNNNNNVLWLPQGITDLKKHFQIHIFFAFIKLPLGKPGQAFVSHIEKMKLKQKGAKVACERSHGPFLIRASSVLLGAQDRKPRVHSEEFKERNRAEWETLSAFPHRALPPRETPELYSQVTGRACFSGELPQTQCGAEKTGCRNKP